MAESIKIGELVYKVTGDVSGLKAALENVDIQLEKTSDKASKFGAMLKKALAVGTIYAFGKAMVKSAADMQQRTVAFTTMLGSAEKAKKLMKEISDFAATTPFELPELTEASKKLVAFGISSEDVIPTLQRIGDVASGLGIPLNDLAEIYGKARVQGTLYAEDLNQLAGRGIPIFDELAKVTGKNASEIKKMASEGKIGFGQLEQVFKNLTSEGGMFFGGMEAQSKTFAGVMSTMNDALDMAGRALGEDLLPGLTDLFKAFGDSVNSGGVIISVLGSVSRAAGFVAESLATTIRLLDLMTIDQKQKEFEAYQNGAIDLMKTLRKEYGTLKNLKERAAAGDDKALKDYGAMIMMESDMAGKQRDMNKLSAEEERIRRAIKGIEEEEQKIKGQKNDAEEKRKPLIKANAEEAKKAAEEEKKAQAELEEQYRKKVDAILGMINGIGGAINNVLSAGSQLAAAMNQSRLDELDARMQKELEAAGVAEETQVEQAQREYDAAVATGDALNIEEKRRQLEKSKIMEKYEKKRRQIEYEGALLSWQFQLAQATAAAPLAVLNAFTAGWKYGPIVAGVYAGLAAVGAGLQIAAVAASKPDPPKFAEGGIVPGTSTQGDRVPVLANSGEMILTQEQQKKLLNGGTGQVIHIHNYIAGTAVGDAIYRMTQDGLVKIDKRAVV